MRALILSFFFCGCIPAFTQETVLMHQPDDQRLVYGNPFERSGYLGFTQQDGKDFTLVQLVDGEEIASQSLGESDSMARTPGGFFSMSYRLGGNAPEDSGFYLWFSDEGLKLKKLLVIPIAWHLEQYLARGNKPRLDLSENRFFVETNYRAFTTTFHRTGDILNILVSNHQRLFLLKVDLAREEVVSVQESITPDLEFFQHLQVGSRTYTLTKRSDAKGGTAWFLATFEGSKQLTLHSIPALPSPEKHITFSNISNQGNDLVFYVEGDHQIKTVYRFHLKGEVFTSYAVETDLTKSFFADSIGIFHGKFCVTGIFVVSYDRYDDYYYPSILLENGSRLRFLAYRGQEPVPDSKDRVAPPTRIDVHTEQNGISVLFRTDRYLFPFVSVDELNAETAFVDAPSVALSPTINRTSKVIVPLSLVPMKPIIEIETPGQTTPGLNPRINESTGWVRRDKHVYVRSEYFNREGLKIVVNDFNVNLRSEGSTASRVLQKLQKGTPVTIISRSGVYESIGTAWGSWTKVAVDDTEGYIFGAFLSPEITMDYYISLPR